MKRPIKSKSGATKQTSAKVKPPTYQPTAEELKEEYDMPGADMKTLRKAFFKPLDEERQGVDKV